MIEVGEKAFRNVTGTESTDSDPDEHGTEPLNSTKVLRSKRKKNGASTFRHGAKLSPPRTVRKLLTPN